MKIWVVHVTTCGGDHHLLAFDYPPQNKWVYDMYFREEYGGEDYGAVDILIECEKCELITRKSE